MKTDGITLAEFNGNLTQGQGRQREGERRLYTGKIYQGTVLTYV